LPPAPPGPPTFKLTTMVAGAVAPQPPTVPVEPDAAAADGAGALPA
jgi:hypothetical protein